MRDVVGERTRQLVVDPLFYNRVYCRVHRRRIVTETSCTVPNSSNPSMVDASSAAINASVFRRRLPAGHECAQSVVTAAVAHKELGHDRTDHSQAAADFGTQHQVGNRRRNLQSSQSF